MVEWPSDHHLRGLNPNAPQQEDILNTSLFTDSAVGAGIDENQSPYDEDEYTDHLFYVEHYGEGYLEDRKRICSILGLTDSELDYHTYSFFMYKSEEEVRKLWDDQKEEREEYFSILRQIEEMDW
jgi:hypothetical protein